MGYKTISISPNSFISITLHSGVALAIACSESTLRAVLKSGSLKIDNCSWFGLSCVHSLPYHWQVIIEGGTHSKVSTLEGAFFGWHSLCKYGSI